MNETTPLVYEPSFSIGYRMQHNDNPFFSISIIYIILFDSLIGKEEKGRWWWEGKNGPAALFIDSLLFYLDIVWSV